MEALEEAEAGGGGTYQLPEDIAYDDPLYTTYIKRDLTTYRGGTGGKSRESNNTSATKGSSYPSFSSNLPVWYGGGNGGGGGTDIDTQGAAGTAGSPGGILIEEATYD